MKGLGFALVLLLVVGCLLGTGCWDGEKATPAPNSTPEVAHTPTPTPTPGDKIGTVPPSEVLISIDISPESPIADGVSTFIVTARVIDVDGMPVAGEQVRFTSWGFRMGPNDEILGATDPEELGVSYRMVHSGGFPTPGTNGLRNTHTTTTQMDGEAHAEYRVPNWRDYMSEKPISIRVWYHVDGGGNPFASTLVWFSKP